MKLSQTETRLSPEKGQELGHHLLKAHLFKHMTNLHHKSNGGGSSLSGSNGSNGSETADEPIGPDPWIAMSASTASEALVCPRHVFNPNVKVSRLLLLSGGSPDQVQIISISTTQNY
jgi:hypothetical protein